MNYWIEDTATKSKIEIELFQIRKINLLATVNEKIAKLKQKLKPNQ